MYFKKRGQAAVEFLMVVGVAFTMLVPALYLFTQYSSTSNQIVIASQVERIGKEIISSAESVYYYGKNSKSTIKLSFPEKINSIYLNPKKNKTCAEDTITDDTDSCVSELVFNVSIFGGESHFVFYTPINITLNITSEYSMQDAVQAGLKSLAIESYGDYINITRKLN
jgi:uncharacterized protein (UPF0333 family)